MPNASSRSVVELRRYALRGGQRDTLIHLFEREFIEPQEAVGMELIGQFRDLDRPDRFVWLRGFRNMEQRARALAAFYDGPVWKAHRDAANTTMLDSDDVFLLHPVGDAGFAPEAPRPPPGTTALPDSVINITLFFLRASEAAGFARFFQEQLLPVWRETGAAPLAQLETEHSPNTFPKLPVRTGEHVFVAVTRFANLPASRAHEAKLAGSDRWTEEVLPRLRMQLMHEPEVLHLVPTPRSRLR